MQVSLIAALDRKLAIGKGNDLPWHLPDDLRRFKALTLGKAMLMGRKTAQSLGRALPGRRNLVLTRSGEAPFPGMEVVDSVDQALDLARDSGELCVIGGAQVFTMTLPLATRLHLTWVDGAVEAADVFFPATLDLAQWRVVGRESHAADDRHAFAFEFVDYAR